jgi:hypothetical protein
MKCGLFKDGWDWSDTPMPVTIPPPPVIARDRKDKYILLGGLGILGVGTMWVKEQSYHTNLPGYKDAMEQSRVTLYDTKTL